MEENMQNFSEDQQEEIEALKKRVETSNLIRKQIALLAGSKNLDLTLKEVLETVGTYANADRAYIFEDRSPLFPNTYEWCAQGVRSEIDALQNLTKEDIKHWIPTLEKGDRINIPDIEEIKDSTPHIYSLLKKQDITSITIAPIMADNKLLGFIGVDNASPDIVPSISNSFLSLGLLIGTVMQVRREQASIKQQNIELKKERRRYRDALTNGCEYSYAFDVTEGLIREPFITIRGTNPIDQLGLSLPISFDELNGKWITSSGIQFASEEMAYYFNRKGLLEQFHKGITNVPAEYYNPKLDIYIQTSALLSQDADTGHVHAFITATNITKRRKKEVEQRELLQKTKDQLSDSNNELQLLLDSLTMMRDTYYRISCIDLDRNSMQVLLSPEEEKDEEDFRTDYNRSVQNLAASYVMPEHQAKFLNIFLPERLKYLMSNDVSYIDLAYRRLENGSPHWVRSELMAIPGYGKSHHRIMWYVKDISAEKAMEERLSQQLIKTNAEMSLRLETVLGGISGGFKICRDDGRLSFDFVSTAAAAIQGYTVQEFMEASNGSAADNIYSEDYEKTIDSIHKQLAKSDGYLLKYRVRHKNGSLKWVQDSGKKVVGENGNIQYYSLLQDITQQEEQSITLHNVLTMQTQMLESLSNGIFAYTMPEHKILLLNQEAKRLFHCPDDESVNINDVMRTKVPTEDYQVFWDVKNALKKPGDHIKYTFRTRAEDGRTLYIQSNTRLLQFEEGQLYILSSMTDLTERFHMEALLSEERKQYRDVLIEGSELSFSFDLSEGIINESISSQTKDPGLNKIGLEPPVAYDDLAEAWLRSKGLTALEPEENAHIGRNALLHRFEAGENRIEIEYHAAKTDQYYRVLILLSESKNDGHIHATFIAYNTTGTVKEAMKKKIEQKRKDEAAKAALQDAYNAAQRANAAKTDFLANMSHDIRTPMNAIIGLTAIAGTHLDDKERVADCLSKITVSSKHLLGLINEVLDMSKIESGKIDLALEDFNLPDLIDNLLTMCKPQIEAKHQELLVNISNIEHEKVIGDVQRIQQSFMNLMGNAIKYTPENGKITLSITEKPNNQHKVGCYEFIFEDNGIGMSPDFLSRLFEPFERAKDSRVESTQGTGLGMAITKNIVQMMNGDIKVESELDKGTRFTVTIFLKLQDVDENISYEDFIDLPVLVADDDQISCESTCDILTDLGMKSQWVLTGREAVQLVSSHHDEKNDFFAVILDWKMPDMNGVETTREIRRLVGRDIPIIIISAYDWSDIELEARMAGADAFISKPLFKSRVAHLFNKLLSKSEEEEQDSSLSSIASQRHDGKRALLVEDNEINSEIAGEILSMAGLTVEYASNGKEALDLMAAAADGYYDIIFMDIQMPIMNGYEATRAIRELSGSYAKRVPIIAMTANAFAEDVAAAKNAGMNEHIAKPLDFDQLAKVLQRWIG